MPNWTLQLVPASQLAVFHRVGSDEKQPHQVAHVKKLEWSKLSSCCKVSSEMKMLLHRSSSMPSMSPVSAAAMPSPKYFELQVSKRQLAAMMSAAAAGRSLSMPAA